MYIPTSETEEEYYHVDEFPPVNAQLLYDCGHDIKCSGFTPLMLMVIQKDKRVLHYLDKYPYRIDEKNEQGFTALMLASLNGDVEMAKILLLAGANINIRNNIGYTSLMIASKYNKLEQLIDLHIQYGADINLQSNRGATALISASCNSRSTSSNTIVQK